MATKFYRHLFWLASRFGRFVYSRFPVFGKLKASLGVIHRDGAFLVIERSDGLGISFPGGLTFPWESAERALVREILEETGLRVIRYALNFSYDSGADLPVRVTVYDVEVEGAVRDSWEGTPLWQNLSELRLRIMPGQGPVVEMLARRQPEA